MLKEIFTWWNGKTLGTRIWSFFNGVLVGTDSHQNQYYRNKNDTRRWVIYSGSIESTKVSPEWNNWLRFTSLNSPKKIKKFNWQKEHKQNLTGTPSAFNPEIREYKNETTSKLNDYKKWSPDNNKYNK